MSNDQWHSCVEPRKAAVEDFNVTTRSLVAAINASVLPIPGQPGLFRLELCPHMEGFCQLAITFRGKYPSGLLLSRFTHLLG
jgi:hypothetical protein